MKPAQERPATEGPAYRAALAGLCLAVLLPALGTSIAHVALPTLSAAFGVGFGPVQWVVLAYLLTMTCLVVGVGRLGDGLGRRRLLRAGLVLFTVASALCALAPGLEALVLARALQGLGAAMMTAMAMALVADTVPGGRAGRVIGLLGTMSAIGTALGPSLGGVLLAVAGWRALFLVAVPLGLVAILLAWRALPEGAAPGAGVRSRFDGAGMGWLALGVAGYALALGGAPALADSTRAALLVGALLAGAMLVRAARRADEPLIAPALLRDAGLSASLLMSLLVAAVMMATLVVGPFYLSRAFGLAAGELGLAVACGPLVAALCAAPAGRWVDRIGAARATRFGLLGVGGGALVLALAAGHLGLVGYMAAVACMTASYALFQTANNTGVMTGVAGPRRGVVSGLLNLSRNLGLMTGTALMGAVFWQAAQEGGAAAGLRASFTLAAAMIGLALLSGPLLARLLGPALARGEAT
jgi:MFS family permease